MSLWYNFHLFKKQVQGGQIDQGPNYVSPYAKEEESNWEGLPWSSKWTTEAMISCSLSNDISVGWVDCGKELGTNGCHVLIKFLFDLNAWKRKMIPQDPEWPRRTRNDGYNTGLKNCLLLPVNPSVIYILVWIRFPLKWWMKSVHFFHSLILLQITVCFIVESVSFHDPQPLWKPVITSLEALKGPSKRWKSG